MRFYFEIFDLVSGNVVDIYANEREAVDALLEVARVQGVVEIERFALTHEQGSNSRLIAMQDDLVRLITREMVRMRPVSAT